MNKLIEKLDTYTGEINENTESILQEAMKMMGKAGWGNVQEKNFLSKLQILIKEHKDFDTKMSNIRKMLF
jgi:hypothetical protein